MARSVFKPIWRFLTRLSVAAVLISVLLLLTALGSCFPQRSALVAADAERLSLWQAGVRTRYGPLADLLKAVGALRWYSSPIFLISLGLLATATLICTFDRWRTVWRRAEGPPVGPSDLSFDAAPYTATLSGLPVAGLLHTARQCLKGRGFRVRSETRTQVCYLQGDRNRLAVLATLVTHLAVLLLLLGAMLSTRLGWREELTIEPYRTAEIKSAGQFLVRNEGFTIARYPDGDVAAYQAQVAIVDGSQEVMRGNLGINDPLTHSGIGIYLSGYRPSEEGNSITLLAVHDPGYGLVIAAGFLLLLGLTVSFNFPRCWVQARIGPDGTLRLAGWAERRAWDFEREFGALPQEIGRLAGSEQEEID
jgi:cytochrome c biogenesis protein